MKNYYRTSLAIIFILMQTILFAQEEEVIEVVEMEEETVLESTEANVNSYYKNNTADIVTGEIDNTLLIFKGKNSSLYGLKNKNNEILVKPIFNSISSYNSTKNRIQANFGWKKNGVIDQKGNIIIPFEYSNISKNKGLYTVTTNNNERFLLDNFGKPLLKNSYEEIYLMGGNNYIKVKDNGLYGILNILGEELFPMHYDEISYNSGQDWFLLNRNGISMIKGADGKDIFGKKYTSISKLDYSFKYIMAEKNGKFGIVNKSDQIVAPFEFEAIKKNYDNRHFIVKKNGKWGVFNVLFDKFIIEPKYDEVTLLSSDYYLLRNEDQKTMINLILNKKFDVSRFDEVKKYISYDKAKVEKNNLKGAISINTGKVIIPLKYTYIDMNSNYLKGTIPGKKQYDIYSNDGKLLVQNANSIRRLGDRNNYRVSGNGKVGVISKNKVTVPLEYDFIKNNKEFGVLFVQTDNKYGLIDYKNNFIIPLNDSKIIVTKDNIIWKKKKYIITLGKLVELK